MPEVQLKASHIIIPPEISENLFKESDSIFIAFKNEVNAILISPLTNAWFKQLHKAEQKLLKSKDLKGTKSIAIREMLLDHELSDENRILSFQINSDKKFLKIQL